MKKDHGGRKGNKRRSGSGQEGVTIAGTKVDYVIIGKKKDSKKQHEGGKRGWGKEGGNNVHLATHLYANPPGGPLRGRGGE